MKRYIISLLIVLAFCGVGKLGAAEAGVDSLWAKAVTAYSSGEWQTALESFEEVELAGYASADLYYNIANCHFKVGHSLGRAIQYYERALKVDPSHKDAAFNLQMAREQTIDRIDAVPEFVAVTWLKHLRDTLSSNMWLTISFVLMALTAALVLVFRFSLRRGLRKAAFGLAIVSVVMALCSLAMSLSLRSRLAASSEAVVIVPVSSIKASPADSDRSLFILHEGTKVKIVDRVGEWLRIELTDGRQGWTHEYDLGLI